MVLLIGGIILFCAFAICLLAFMVVAAYNVASTIEEAYDDLHVEKEYLDDYKTNRR